MLISKVPLKRQTGVWARTAHFWSSPVLVPTTRTLSVSHFGNFSHFYWKPKGSCVGEGCGLRCFTGRTSWTWSSEHGHHVHSRGTPVIYPRYPCFREGLLPSDWGVGAYGPILQFARVGAHHQVLMFALRCSCYTWHQNGIQKGLHG